MKRCVSKVALILPFRRIAVNWPQWLDGVFVVKGQSGVHPNRLLKFYFIVHFRGVQSVRAGLEYSFVAKHGHKIAGAGQKDCNLNNNHHIHKYAKNPCLKLIHIHDRRGRNGLGHQVKLLKQKEHHFIS
ncbi:Uncharacterized protein TCM_016804 [Theobroma cacao]|uniref:Uncharacterized protein n=1 Tax=Theobroma cacao TaxID=3641 RepID=A0A061ED02_THECC|nr:Uncharacterized protein TCM_016804 [Theobroma cacao]